MRMRYVFGLSFGVGVTFVALACSPVDRDFNEPSSSSSHASSGFTDSGGHTGSSGTHHPTPSAGMGGDGGAGGSGSFALTASPSTLVVAQGKSVEVTLSVKRSNPKDGLI